MNAIHLLISGEVQGVGYRWWTQRAALELGLVGWVRNLRDGRVEAWIEGDKAERLAQRCEQGPPSAVVDRVERRAAPAERPLGFEIFPTVDSPRTLAT